MAELWDDPPFVAILRGLAPAESVSIAGALFDAGFKWLEVPMNSPDAPASIAAIRRAFDKQFHVGAGTIILESELHAVVAAGADFIVSPNTDPAIIRATKAASLISMPGFFSPSEAFAALAAGADALKLFPAEIGGTTVVKALKSVLPPSAPLLAVGGVTETSLATYLDVGAAGAGLGSALYRPGATAYDVGKRAESFIAAFHAWRER